MTAYYRNPSTRALVREDVEAIVMAMVDPDRSGPAEFMRLSAETKSWPYLQLVASQVAQTVGGMVLTVGPLQVPILTNELARLAVTYRRLNAEGGQSNG